MKIKVSELIVRYMERLGIDAIFGMPGAHILPIYDALYDSAIQAILAKHEQGAAFMAGGYAKSSGKVSACIATAGPGATNLITGIANAYADKQPVLVVTGEAPTYIFGKGGLQESSGEGGSFDQVALFRHITRYSKTVERTDYLPQVLIQASKALLSSNPGPVLLSIPFNVQSELVDEDVLDELTIRPDPTPTPQDNRILDIFCKQLLSARQPVIIAGYGAIRSGAQQVVTELSHLLQIPVASSLKGKGIVNEQSPLSLGSLGVTSSGNAYKYIVEKSDLLIILGAGFNERTSYLWDQSLLGNRSIIQIDSDPHQLEKVFEAELTICGDIKAVLNALLDRLQQHVKEDGDSTDAVGKITHLKASSNGDYAIFKSGFSLAEAFFSKLAEQFRENTRVFDDNIIFAQNFYDVSSRNHYYPNSGISSLGHAIPAAIGAQFTQQRPTFAILGDGGFQMCCMEIMTAVNYNKPLNIVMFNNGTMGLIRKNQHQLYQQRFINCDFINPDYNRLAQSFGINYKQVTTLADLDNLFEDYDMEQAINLIDISIDKDAFPNYSSKR
ncbi:MAG: thiamine pyrophosphate-binding protein [Candidatus Thiodiazotropha sp. (ex Lucinoma borealis)]|nr:thiamine pyrophosphate-binding protein [Candidatus Thiodiazotropha sp. (ex Lucinoma borealis)]MCU7854328.1 thiamine pyrophosphate-binding protein [Candidatus Thiodiazotropha sp. (ex Lucinoma borealis)]MCU7865777.1 thiamine pyrophosphate-binding protein [Candidatus Thiodiazotropha sp. (ex Lucinoma borealis)]MCU7869505.1 thiamine pyrophosphate-binding protein [Candidatus Thiodiazotropha sp. (ex Lucinoma borealis)]